MEEILQEIGFSKNESIIYLTLSKLGASSAYKIAKESKIFKANTYEILKKLENEGLVSKRVIEGKTFYEASDPSLLIDVLEEKKEKINKILPTIRLIQKSPKEESIFNTHKGTDSFMNILYHFLEFKEDILVYGAPKRAYELMKYKIDHFHKERIKRKIKMKHVYNFEAIGRIREIKKMPYTDTKCLPEIFDSQVSTNICGDEVVFVIWNPPIKVIQIKDKDMAKAYKNYFKILWKMAKKAF